MTSKGPFQPKAFCDSVLWGKAERVGVIQPGEEKAAGTPYSSLPLGKMKSDFLPEPTVTEQRTMVLN